MRQTVDENDNLWLIAPDRTIDLRTWEVPFPERIPEPFAVIDFEAYYSKKYSLETCSTWEYVQKPAFNPYLAAMMLVLPGGRARVSVGQPERLPWESINGIRWLSHNVAFDELVFRKCQANKLWHTLARPRAWDCTLDMLAWMQCRRGLEVACEDLLGVEIDKSVIDRAKGGTENVSTDDLLGYVFRDVFYPAMLFCRYGHLWPENERILSRQTRRIGWEGVWVDPEQLVQDIKFLNSALARISLGIPWRGGGRSITSLDELKRQCALEGIPAPKSADLTKLDVIAWDRKYGKTRPWLHLIKRYTRARQTKAFFEMLLLRRRRDGTVPFTLRYSHIPHTRRWAAAENLRIHNLDVEDCEGIKVRHRIRPRPGELFIIVDLTQIEPRVLNWLAGNHRFLEECRKGASPYEAHARNMGDTTPNIKKAKPLMYALYKAQTLALGYQAAAPKFMTMAREYCNLFLHEFEWTAALMVAGKTIWYSQADIENAQHGHGDGNLRRAIAEKSITMFPPARDTVRQFRTNAREVRNFWYECEARMRADIGRDHMIDLPCGTIRYFDVREEDSQLFAKIVRNSANPRDRRDFYGGKLAENRTQFVSRCALAEKLLLLERMPVGRLNWHVHDEAIIRVPARHAEEMLHWTLEKFRLPVPWAPEIPLGAEGSISDKYDK